MKTINEILEIQPDEFIDNKNASLEVMELPDGFIFIANEPTERVECKATDEQAIALAKFILIRCGFAFDEL